MLMIAVWQKKGQQMVQVDKGKKTKQQAATQQDSHNLPPSFSGIGNLIRRNCSGDLKIV